MKELGKNLKKMLIKQRKYQKQMIALSLNIKCTTKF